MDDYQVVIMFVFFGIILSLLVVRALMDYDRLTTLEEENREMRQLTDELLASDIVTMHQVEVLKDQIEFMKYGSRT